MKARRIAAYLVPFAFFTLLLQRFGIGIFGSRTLLISDLNAQYIEFLAELQRILKGQGSFLWSWNAGLGMSMPALLAYYLASPLNLLVVLFPPEKLPEAVNLIIGLKLALACGNFALYLEKHPDLSALRRIGFGLLYAFCGWSAAYYFNLMMLDALLLLPLLCRGIDRLAEDRSGSFAQLTLLFALCFLSQFYMSYMCGLFCVLYLAETLVRIRKDRLRTLFRFGTAVGIAAGLSAFLLLPTYLTLKNNMGLMGQSVGGFSVQFDFFTQFRKLFPAAFDGTKDCLPHIYCGLPALIGFLCFLFDKKLPLRERIAGFSVTAFLCVSFWIRPLDFFWHAMDVPSWFPYRYSFVFCFHLLSLAAASLPDGKSETGKRIPLICAGLLAACALLCGVRTKSFGLTAVFLTAYALCFGAIRSRREIFLTLLLCAELFLNTCDVWQNYVEKFISYDEYLGNSEAIRAVLPELLPEGNAFYRLEKTPLRTYNEPMRYGYPGISHFSSTASIAQSEYLKRLGFDCFATWCMYRGADSASNAMLGIRYILSGEQAAENEAVFPLFFYASEDYARLNYRSDEQDPAERQDLMLRLLAGSEEPFFESLPVRMTESHGLAETDDPDVREVSDAGAYWEAEIDGANCSSGVVYIADFSLNYNVFLNGEQKLNANRDYSPFLLPLSGRRNSIRIEAANEKQVRTETRAYCFNDERLSTLAERLNAEAPRMTRTGYSDFTLEILPAENDRLLMTSIPFDAGWSFRFENGQTLPLRTIHESMLGTTVPAGAGGTLRVRYFPYGMKEGLLISAAAAAAFCACLFIGARIRRKKA